MKNTQLEGQTKMPTLLYIEVSQQVRSKSSKVQ